MHKQHPVAAGSRRIYRRQKMGFVLIHIAYFFLKLQDMSYFSRFNKFFKTLLTHSTCRGIFLVNPTALVDWFEPFHKMWSCSFWTLPRRGLSLKNSPPRNTPDSFCRCFTRQNPSLCCMGGIFLLRETHLENLMSRPNVISTFRQRRCTNRGRNCVRSKRWPPYISSGTLYLFLRLNNSETFVKNTFWAQR